MVKEDEKLIIEDGVTVLEPLSFVDCKAKEIIMPDSVETIKHCAFKNCDNLKKIVFGKGIKVIDIIYKVVFYVRTFTCKVQ